MINPFLLRKDRQDAMRSDTQADNRIRELEQENERLKAKFAEVNALVKGRKESDIRSHETETMINMILGILNNDTDQ